MGLSGRFVLLIQNSALALVGAAATLALVHAMSEDTSRVRDRTAVGSADAGTPPAANRLAFVTPGALSKREPPPETPDFSQDFRPSVTPNSVGMGAWSIEVKPETAPSSARLSVTTPSLRVRRQAAKLAARRRDYTLKKRLAEIAPATNIRLAKKFDAAKAAFPPAEIAFVAIKDRKVLELHARQAGGAWKRIHSYRIFAASGTQGPKLSQGDRQVPEGIYGISFLNPNSAYHLSLRVNYPNAFDRRMAATDGRKNLGGDIMVHGKSSSAGCLAMGDEAAEELFVLAAETGLSKVRLIIAPTDFRRNGLPPRGAGQPEWLPKLYAEIATAMAEYKAPRSTGLLSFFTQ